MGPKRKISGLSLVLSEASSHLRHSLTVLSVKGFDILTFYRLSGAIFIEILSEPISQGASGESVLAVSAA